MGDLGQTAPASPRWVPSRPSLSSSYFLSPPHLIELAVFETLTTLTPSQSNSRLELRLVVIGLQSLAFLRRTQSVLPSTLPPRIASPVFPDSPSFRVSCSVWLSARWQREAWTQLRVALVCCEPAIQPGSQSSGVSLPVRTSDVRGASSSRSWSSVSPWWWWVRSSFSLAWPGLGSASRGEWVSPWEPGTLWACSCTSRVVLSRPDKWSSHSSSLPLCGESSDESGPARMRRPWSVVASPIMKSNACYLWLRCRGVWIFNLARTSWVGVVAASASESSLLLRFVGAGFVWFDCLTWSP